MARQAMFDARQCWFLVGPTAVGKSAVALSLARRIDAEILSLDSMAVYRRLDIGTAKPSRPEQAEIPHHLVDLVEPDESFSLARYVSAAHRAAAEVHRRQRRVLFTGGTPLYLKSLLRGIFEGPAADWKLRRQWEAMAREQPQTWLHDQLAAIDPPAAGRLHPNDTRRLIRALEVYQKTGRPMSEWQQQFERAATSDRCRVFVLDRPRPELYERIDQRVRAMFDQGLVDEVQGLLAEGRSLGRTASQALGYREVLELLGGARTLEATIELVQQRTRQFARRQLTWFRSLQECRWVAIEGHSKADETADFIVRMAQGDIQGRAN